MKFLSPLLVCFYSLPTLAVAQKQLEAMSLCRNGEIVRSIRVEKSSDEDYACIYTKYGVDRQVGQGQNLASVKGILNNIKGNLEKAGWQCRDASTASIIESEQ